MGMESNSFISDGSSTKQWYTSHTFMINWSQYKWAGTWSSAVPSDNVPSNSWWMAIQVWLAIETCFSCSRLPACQLSVCTHTLEFVDLVKIITTKCAYPLTFFCSMYYGVDTPKWRQKEKEIFSVLVFANGVTYTNWFKRAMIFYPW